MERGNVLGDRRGGREPPAGAGRVHHRPGFHKKALVPHKKIVRIPSIPAHFALPNSSKCDTSCVTDGDGNRVRTLRLGNPPQPPRVRWRDHGYGMDERGEVQGPLSLHFLSERRRRRAGGSAHLRRVPGGRGLPSSTPSTSGSITACGAASPNVSAAGCSAVAGSVTPSPSDALNRRR